MPPHGNIMPYHALIKQNVGIDILNPYIIMSHSGIYDTNPDNKIQVITL